MSVETSTICQHCFGNNRGVEFEAGSIIQADQITDVQEWMAHKLSLRRLLIMLVARSKGL